MIVQVWDGLTKSEWPEINQDGIQYQLLINVELILNWFTITIPADRPTKNVHEARQAPPRSPSNSVWQALMRSWMFRGVECLETSLESA